MEHQNHDTRVGTDIEGADEARQPPVSSPSLVPVSDDGLTAESLLDSMLQTRVTSARLPRTGGDIVYFLLDFAEKAIKIGTTRRHPMARYRDLQIGQPYPLLPLGTCPGDRKLEKQLHEEFRHLKLYGEWFKNTRQLEMRIRYLCLNYVACRDLRARIRRLAMSRGCRP